jgi:hypothetical protein
VVADVVQPVLSFWKGLQSICIVPWRTPRIERSNGTSTLSELVLFTLDQLIDARADERTEISVWEAEGSSIVGNIEAVTDDWDGSEMDKTVAISDLIGPCALMTTSASSVGQGGLPQEVEESEDEEAGDEVKDDVDDGENEDETALDILDNVAAMRNGPSVEQQEESDNAGASRAQSHADLADDKAQEGMQELMGAFRQLTEKLQQHGIKWLMLSYAWGENQSYQKHVLRLYIALIKRRVPVWMDVAGMTGDVHVVMAAAVEGAAAIAPVMTTAYQNDGHCKDELCFGKQKQLPVVAIKGEAGFEASGWLGLVTAGSLWSEVLPEMEAEEFEKKMDRFAEHVLKTEGIERFPAELVPSLGTAYQVQTVAPGEESLMEQAVHRLTLKFKNASKDNMKIKVASDQSVEEVLAAIRDELGEAVILEKVTFQDDFDERTVLKGEDMWQEAVQAAIGRNRVLMLRVFTVAARGTPQRSPKKGREVDFEAASGSTLPPLPDVMIAVLEGRDFLGSFLTTSKAKKCERKRVKPINRDSDEGKAFLATVTFHRTGTPEHNTVYKKHLDPSKRCYIPLAQFDEVMLEAKRAEFLSIARQLCAKSITVTQPAELIPVNANVNTEGVGEGGAWHSRADANVGSPMDLTFNKPAELIPMFKEEQAWFYQWEPSWQTMVDGRLDQQGAHTLSYKCDFSYKSDSAKLAQLTLGMQGIGLDLLAARKSHTQAWTRTARWNSGKKTIAINPLQMKRRAQWMSEVEMAQALL